MNVRFAEPCRENCLALSEWENKISEASINRPACHECAQDIYIGFFFDGTNNNKFRDTAKFAHSNIARLYEAFIGTPAAQQQPVLAPSVAGGKKAERASFPDRELKPKGFPEQDFQYYRKIYISGVGTPFPEIGDSGSGIDKKAGLACAFLGEARLCWAMQQVCNQVHAAITNKPLRESLPFEAGAGWGQTILPEKLDPIAAEYELRLHQQLKTLEMELAAEVKRRGDNKPKIRSVRLSVFGFSRGAAAARAFVNRVVARWGSGVAGIKLQIDFLGIFDTVASVGLAQSIPRANGHFAWANEGSLAVSPLVSRCVHLVAAHEVRASFPLDSICSGSGLPDNCKEIIYPGMHSDVGGGYPPNDQGRALGAGSAGDCLKLSQVPLTQMYREARMAGVPLGGPGQLIDQQKRNFEISPTLRADFNAYVAATRNGRIPPTNGKGDATYARMFPTEEQPREHFGSLLLQHYAYFLQWHKSILGRAHQLPGMAVSPNASKSQDIEDARVTDEALQKEIRFLEDKSPEKFEKLDDPAMEGVIKGLPLAPLGAVVTKAPGALAMPGAVASMLTATGVAIMLSVFAKQLMQKAMREKQRQWDTHLKDIWHGKPILAGKQAADAKKLFECYVHDSRAWFKPLLAKDGFDGDVRKIKLVKSILGLDGYEMALDDEDWFVLGGREKDHAAQKRALEKTKEEQKVKNDLLGLKKTEEQLKTLEERGPVGTGGQEPYRLYGYVRFRKVYQSGQLNDDYARKRQKIIEQDEQARKEQQRKEERVERETKEENARHEAEKKRIREDGDRVIKDKSRSTSEVNNYLDGNRESLARENQRHAGALKAIK